MQIFTILLVFSTASCLLQRAEHKHTQDGVSEVEQGNSPVGCADQLSFVREERIEGEYLGAYGSHRHYLYKSHLGCNASVAISHDTGVVSDPIAFMDTKKISCGTDSAGSLLLNFLHYKHEEYQKLKFPCDTKEIAITKIASWDEFNGYIDKFIKESNPSNKKNRTNKDKADEADKDEADKKDKWLEAWYLQPALWGLRMQGKLGDWLMYALFSSLAHGTKLTARGLSEFSDHYKTFMKKVLGGLIIIYANHQQTTLHNHPYEGYGFGTEGHPYRVMGVSKEGSVVYHIMVDKDGKKQTLYPQK